MNVKRSGKTPSDHKFSSRRKSKKKLKESCSDGKLSGEKSKNERCNSNGSDEAMQI